MKTLIQGYLVIGLLSLGLSGCGSKAQSDNKEEEIAKKSFVEKQVVKVATSMVRKGFFSRELLSNGKLSASQKAVVPFLVQDQITAVHVNNGDRVNKGILLAQLDPFVYEKRLEEARNQYEKTRIDLEDQLLSYGYAMKDTADAPDNILKMCLIRSGYNQSRSNLEVAERNFSQTRLVAPIAGVVANLEAQTNNPSSNYKRCCEVLDDRKMQVEFPVLEGEMIMVENGQKVEVIPFAFPSLTFIGSITAVNPTVDVNGMVMIKAEIDNPQGKLIDGMNVKVLVKNEVPDCLIIPKTALLYRQNRKVVFVNENNIAKWIYVETGQENSSEVTISDKSLAAGQEVIISNNLNLAHETPIIVNN